MALNKKRILLTIGFPVLILSIPLIAMQFTNELNWSIFDFILMGVLLFTFSFSVDYIIQKSKNSKQKFLLILTIVLAFLIIWIELAVGIF